MMKMIMISAFLVIILCAVQVASIKTEPPITTTFESSLPIVKIDVVGKTIDRYKRVVGTLEVIFNDEGPNRYADKPIGWRSYAGYIDIRYRGNRSFKWPQKPYNFQTLENATSSKKKKTPMMGMPAGSTWLLKAGGSELTSLRFFRDSVTFAMSRSIGRWAPRTQYCEVFVKSSSSQSLQDQYQGVYMFFEAPKINPLRIPVKPPTNLPNTSYVMSVLNGHDEAEQEIMPTACDDRVYAIEEPSPATPEQLTFIKKYLEDICLKRGDWKNNVDLMSWADNFLMLQIVKAKDTMLQNNRLYRDEQGPLQFGPLWDLDVGMSGSDDIEGWLLNYQETKIWTSMFQSADLTPLIKQRWVDLRNNMFTTDKVIGFLQSDAGDIKESMIRLLVDDFDSRVKRVKSFLTSRMEWMDKNMNTCCPQ